VRESISFSKLKTGRWGVRVAKKGKHPEPGSVVVVQKRSGDYERVTLGAVVGSDPGAFPGPALYYLIDRRRAVDDSLTVAGVKTPPRSGPIAARYPGKCPRCQNEIREGDPITKKDEKYVHAACAEADMPKTTEPQEQLVFIHGYGQVTIAEAEKILERRAKVAEAVETIERVDQRVEATAAEVEAALRAKLEQARREGLEESP
jgi:hypothetical protein